VPSGEGGWVCTSPNLPGIAWLSGEDLTRNFPVVIECSRLEKPLGPSGRAWYSMWRLVRLLEGLL
jgi:hypothetical protein